MKKIIIGTYLISKTVLRIYKNDSNFLIMDVQDVAVRHTFHHHNDGKRLVKNIINTISTFFNISAKITDSKQLMLLMSLPHNMGEKKFDQQVIQNYSIYICMQHLLPTKYDRKCIKFNQICFEMLCFFTIFVKILTLKNF